MSFFRHVLPLLILAVCGGVAGLLIAFREDPVQRTPPKAPLLVDAVRLKRESYPVTVTSRGAVQPRTESTLIPEVSGTVLAISPSFREGEFFEKGEVLLTIDPLDYETAVTVAKSTLAQTTVMLEEEKARAEQALDNWRELGNQKAPSALVLREPHLAEAIAREAGARAQLIKAERDLARTEIRAPYVGRVLEQNVDVGQYVGPGTVLARIYAVDYVEIRLPLTNDQLAFVDLQEKYRHGDGSEDAPALSDSPDPPRPGPEVILHGKLGKRTYSWKGRIFRVEGAIDERSRQLFVVAQVDDPYERPPDGTPPLKIGLYVEAEIEGIVLDDVFVLPRAAVRAGSEIILIDQENRLVRTAIEPLWSDDEFVVLEPATNDVLVEGAAVCVTPLSFAANGVEVVPRIEGETPPLTEAHPSGRDGAGQGGDPGIGPGRAPAPGGDSRPNGPPQTQEKGGPS